jgi:hypothetical protein
MIICFYSLRVFLLVIEKENRGNSIPAPSFLKDTEKKAIRQLFHVQFVLAGTMNPCILHKFIDMRKECTSSFFDSSRKEKIFLPYGIKGSRLDLPRNIGHLGS